MPRMRLVSISCFLVIHFLLERTTHKVRPIYEWETLNLPAQSYRLAASFTS
jgi:hypothetical protein